MDGVDVWYFVSVMVSKYGVSALWRREIRVDGKVMVVSQLINQSEHDNPFLMEVEQ